VGASAERPLSIYRPGIRESPVLEAGAATAHIAQAETIPAKIHNTLFMLTPGLIIQILRA
jgi:hypothetical protein